MLGGQGEYMRRKVSTHVNLRCPKWAETFRYLHFFLCQRTALHQDSVCCLTKCIFYGSIIRIWLAWCLAWFVGCFPTPALAQISFRSHRLLFSHASAEVRGKNTPVRKFASTGRIRTHSHQVMCPTRLSLTYPGGTLSVLDHRDALTPICQIIAHIKQNKKKKTNP